MEGSRVEMHGGRDGREGMQGMQKGTGRGGCGEENGRRERGGGEENRGNGEGDDGWRRNLERSL